MMAWPVSWQWVGEEWLDFCYTRKAELVCRWPGWSRHEKRTHNRLQGLGPEQLEEWNCQITFFGSCEDFFWRNNLIAKEKVMKSLYLVNKINLHCPLLSSLCPEAGGRDIGWPTGKPGKVQCLKYIFMCVYTCLWQEQRKNDKEY